MKGTLPRLIGPALGALVLVVSAAAGWNFATALIASCCGLLAGSVAGLLVSRHKDQE
ncbi:MAG: hypothetical protein K8I27_10020 [Planctomycetes bacterium]|nr:hypothetical protein [Planctomycetota bacterium]